MSKKLPHDRFITHASCGKSIVARTNVRIVLVFGGIVGGILASGCGHVMIRQDPCRIVSTAGINSEMEGETLHPCHPKPFADRFAFMKAKLEWQGVQLKNGVDRCSGKLAECWYSSRVAQWAEKHREQANAPPLPRFHPVPTHPALFPERGEPNEPHPVPIELDKALETIPSPPSL